MSRRFAYADPPYPGQSKRVYGRHPDFGGEVDHAALLERLVSEYPDGWALSTSASALGDVLGLMPDVAHVRVCCWMRGPCPRPPARIMWSWEPLILCVPHWRRRGSEPFVRDAFYAMHPGSAGSVTGQKPPGFCEWVFNLLGARPGDELDDLFPGSGAVARTWESWQAQLPLNLARPELDRVHEEVEWLTEMFESEGAEWGDRLAEAEGELARLHNRLGRSEDTA